MQFFLQSLKSAATGKSKTINVNVLLTGLLVWYSQTRQVPLTPEEAALLVGLVYGLANIVLRFATGKSLPEKGLTIPRPEIVDEIAAVAAADAEAAERLAEQLLPAIRNVIRKRREAA